MTQSFRRVFLPSVCFVSFVIFLFILPRLAPRLSIYSLDRELWKHLLEYNPDLPTNYTPSSHERAIHSGKSMRRMSRFILNHLDQKKNGFFIECGAFDGEWLSNTLVLERDYNWNGLLVEADPAILPILKKRNRRAFVADVCLSPVPLPVKLELKSDRNVGGISYVENNAVANERKDMQSVFQTRYEVQCYPLHMLLDAIGQSDVDYFSLDAEGTDLEILKTIPWERIRIKLISVEIVAPRVAIPLQKYMESIGYRKIQVIKEPSEYLNDHIYELIE